MSEKQKPWFTLRALLAAAVMCALTPEGRPAQQEGPELLTYAELVQLSQQNVSAPPLRDKVRRLLNSPFVDNGASARGVKPLKPEVPHLGRTLRVVFWNIERGINYEAIEAALGDPEKLSRLLDPAKYPSGSKQRAEILNQVEQLRQADVIALNEVDWGMPRSGYRNVIRELAAALNMNYAYGVEFIYKAPIGVGEEPFDKEPADDRESLNDPNGVDTARYKGLHGNAILSRYPLENIRLIALPNTDGEQTAGKKQGAKDSAPQAEQNGSDFLIITSERFGRRMALLTDIADPDILMGRVTIISTHLEALAHPDVRTRQMEILLSHIKGIRHPVILTGDMNTTAIDVTPTSALGVIQRRAASRKFWLRRGLAYITGLGLLLDGVQGVIRFGRTLSDPTVTHIPVVAPNPGAEFFERLESFRFADGAAFDFRGDRNRSTGRHTKTFANSNERDGKGFATTFELPHTFLGFGKFKLDWIFVKPPALTEPYDRKQPYIFAPHFGTTLKDLNYSVQERISDHDPLMVDVPLSEPRIR